MKEEIQKNKHTVDLDNLIHHAVDKKDQPLLRN